MANDETEVGASMVPDESITFSAYGRMLRRRWYVVLVLVVIGAAAGYGLSKTVTKKYAATATLLLTDPSGSVISDEAVNSYAQVATSELVLRSVAAQTGISQSTLRGETTITVPLDTDLIDIEVETSHPQLSADLANEVATGLGRQVPRLSTGGTVTRGAQIAPTPITAARLITPATAPGSPATPTRKIDVAIGIVVGLVVSLLVVLLGPDRRRYT